MFDKRGLLTIIHTDLCVAKCRKFLANEDDPEVELILANALLGNFDTEAVELLWPLVDGMEEDELMPDQRDFRYRLVPEAADMTQSLAQFRTSLPTPHPMNTDQTSRTSDQD